MWQVNVVLLINMKICKKYGKNIKKKAKDIINAIEKSGINIKEIDIKKSAISFIKKRCGYADCYLDKNNKIKINQKNISKAVDESLNLTQNKSFYNYYFN